MNLDTYVIIPVYNEAEVVGKVINGASKHFKNIICVNDGSKDSSAKVIKSKKAMLVEHPINLGAGAATQTGIDFALQDRKAKYFITIDADGQHDIKDAKKMLLYLKKNNLDIVLGSRFLGSVQDITSMKKLFLRLAASFSGHTSGIKLTDPHIGLRVFNRKFAENLQITLHDFAHASEVVNRIAEGGYKYAEVPVTVSYSSYSRAKGQPMLNSVNIAFDVLINKVSKK